MEEEHLETPSLESEPTVPRISKNKLRKERKHLKRLESRKLKRQKAKLECVQKRNPNRNNVEKNEIEKRLQEGQQYGPKVVIDCRYESEMSRKEQCRLTQQLKRVYSSNRASASPLHLYFTSLNESSDFFKLCCQQNDGFAKYNVERTDKSVTEVFSGSESAKKLIYLSPDSPNELETFDPQFIYVIGGLVDETVTNNISYQLTQKEGIKSARLPIDKYFARDDKGTFKKVLTVNQIVDIILEYYRTKDWVAALQAGIPKRTGFVPIPTSVSSANSSSNQ